MAYTFNVNNNPATGAAAIWILVNHLLSSGWSKVMDSDGTTYSSGGTRVTGGGSGANGLNNGSAWVRMRAGGGGGRELTMQRSSPGPTDWRIKYSAGAGFTGGSPGATQTPSATDEQLILGGGTDGSPSYNTLFGVDGSYRWHVCADGAAPYGFYGLAYVNGGGVPMTAFVFDPLVSGTYPAVDPNDDNDPLVMYVGNANPFQLSNLYAESLGPAGWLKKGLAGEGWVRISAFALYSEGGQVIPTNLGSNPHSNEDEGFPVQYGRRGALSAPVGWKGVSSLMKWSGTNRSTGDTVGNKARIVAGAVTLPWDGATTPTV